MVILKTNKINKDNNIDLEQQTHIQCRYLKNKKQTQAFACFKLIL